ncbi:hypothetical protein F900_03371 [Acinetobacter modestus]|uniref:Uncharacterized protein n=1 Tax=Acinetobacter modestus TaxID=1776740 RepID=N9N8M3_9GAMM|nr:hypothetical protein F900_03371 [Acinetobacter modestus]
MQQAIVGFHLDEEILHSDSTLIANPLCRVTLNIHHKPKFKNF